MKKIVIGISLLAAFLIVGNILIITLSKGKEEPNVESEAPSVSEPTEESVSVSSEVAKYSQETSENEASEESFSAVSSAVSSEFKDVDIDMQEEMNEVVCSAVTQILTRGGVWLNEKDKQLQLSFTESKYALDTLRQEQDTSGVTEFPQTGSYKIKSAQILESTGKELCVYEAVLENKKVIQIFAYENNKYLLKMPDRMFLGQSAWDFRKTAHITFGTKPTEEMLTEGS